MPGGGPRRRGRAARPRPSSTPPPRLTPPEVPHAGVPTYRSRRYRSRRRAHRRARPAGQRPRRGDRREPAPAYRWRDVVIGGGGFVTGVLFHPAVRGLAYARTDIGGAYRWDDRTARWTPLTDQLGWDDWNLLGVEALAVDPAAPGPAVPRVGTYAQSWAGNGAILRSEDRGATWSRTDLAVQAGRQRGRAGRGGAAARRPARQRHPVAGHPARRTAQVDRPRRHLGGRGGFPATPSPAARASRCSSPPGARCTRAGATPTGPTPHLYRTTDGSTWHAVPGSPPAPRRRCRSAPPTTAAPTSCT